MGSISPNALSVIKRLTFSAAIAAPAKTVASVVQTHSLKIRFLAEKPNSSALNLMNDFNVDVLRGCKGISRSKN